MNSDAVLIRTWDESAKTRSAPLREPAEDVESKSSSGDEGCWLRAGYPMMTTITYMCVSQGLTQH